MLFDPCLQNSFQRDLKFLKHYRQPVTSSVYMHSGYRRNTFIFDLLLGTSTLKSSYKTLMIATDISRCKSGHTCTWGKWWSCWISCAFIMGRISSSTGHHLNLCTNTSSTITDAQNVIEYMARVNETQEIYFITWSIFKAGEFSLKMLFLSLMLKLTKLIEYKRWIKKTRSRFEVREFSLTKSALLSLILESTKVKNIWTKSSKEIGVEESSTTSQQAFVEVFALCTRTISDSDRDRWTIRCVFTSPHICRIFTTEKNVTLLSTVLL